MSAIEEFEFTKIEDRGYYWCIVDKTLENEPIVESMRELSAWFKYQLPDGSYVNVLPEGVLMDLVYRDGKPAVQRWYFPKFAYPYEKFVRRRAISLDQSYKERLRSVGML
jgi:S-adenosylhomocysteine hydrolase